MSRVRADKLVNRAATGAPSLTYGAEVPVGYALTGAGGINVSGFATISGGFADNVTFADGANVTSGIVTVADTTESTSTTSCLLYTSPSPRDS